MNQTRKRGKADKTGRDISSGSEHWTKLTREILDTPAWRALPSSAQALYPWLRFEWRGAQANNNGRLRLSVAQAATAMGVNKDTAARAFHSLQEKGFLVVTTPARLGISGDAKGSEYELTEISLPGQGRPRRLFVEWRAGHDYPVMKAGRHNPTGRNGTAKSHPQNTDGVIPFLGTSTRKSSPK